MYTHQTGVDVVNFLVKCGFSRATLIGSLAKENGTSSNDIDILIDDESYSKKLEDHFRILLKPKGKVVRTDWGGIYLYDTIYGNVDIFFTTENFDY